MSGKGIWTGAGGVAETFRVTLPLQLMAAAGAACAFFDRLFLARYSDLALEASVPGLVLGGTLTVFMLMTVGYSGVFVAQYHGRGDRDGAVRCFAQGLWLALAALPLYALALAFGRAAVAMSGHAAELAATETAFFGLMMPGLWLQAVAAVIGGYFNGQGRTRVFGIAGLVGSVVNLALDPLFIFGWGPVPEFGLNGVACAFGIAQLTTCALLLVALFRDRHLRSRRGSRLALFRPDPALALRELRYGAENGLMAFVDNLIFASFVMVIGRLDALSLAVSNIAFGVNSIFYALVSGLRDGVSVLTGRYCGKGDFAAADRALSATLVLAAFVVVFFAIFVIGGTDMLAGLFRSDSSAFDPAAYHGLLSAIFIILALRALAEALVEPCAGALRGVGDTRWLMIVRSACGLFVWMPMVAAVWYVRPSLPWLWSTMPAYLFVAGAVMFRRWRSGRWRVRALITPKA